MITAKEHLLENLQVAYQTAIADEQIVYRNQPELQTYYNDMLYSMIIRLSDHVLSEKLNDKTFTKTKTLYRTKPKTCWDMFKIQYGGKWWMRWFGPPKEEIIVEEVTLSVTVQPRLLFPESTLQVYDPLGKPVRYLEYRETME